MRFKTPNPTIKNTKKQEKPSIILKRQIEKDERGILYFKTLQQQIESATLEDALEIRQELEDLGYLKKKKVIRKRKQGAQV